MTNEQLHVPPDLGPFFHNEGLVLPLSVMVANLCEKNLSCLGYIGDDKLNS